MKLYFTPGVCSLSPHIVLREGGFQFDLEKVDIKGKKTASGKDYLTINERGYVPVLELDDGQRLAEGAAIVQYLADLKESAKLAPRAGTLERARVNEWLTFISSEIHKTFSPLFSPISAEATEHFRKKLANRLDYANKQMQGKTYLVGEQFTIADAYLFTVLRWTKGVEMDINRWPALAEFMARMRARPKVKEALEAEGLPG